MVTIQEDDDVVEEEVPFYEKVNRFVFGPEAEPPMPIEVQKKRLVAHIRAKQGRIGLLDVMRVTGLPREEADPLIARLLLDFDGEVDVDDNGAITYRFEKLRKTAGDTAAKAPPPAWDHHKVAPKVTGNTLGPVSGGSADRERAQKSSFAGGAARASLEKSPCSSYPPKVRLGRTRLDE